MTAVTARVPVDDDGAARAAARAARRTAVERGLTGELPERAAACAGELARVLARHSVRGAVYLQPSALRPGLDIVAVGTDPAPGDGADADGAGRWPSGASPEAAAPHGPGPLPDLEALRHLADDFVLRAVPGRGTAVCARLRGPAPGVPGGAREAAVPDVGVLRLPVDGESSCGDAWALEVAPGDGTVTALVADGLGHGPAAAEAAERAVGAFRSSPGLPLPQLMRAVHEALRNTRGAAVGLLRRTPDGAVGHCAVGNVRAYVVGHDGVRHRFGAQPGVVGWNMPAPTAQRLPDAHGGTLLLHSDGVDGGWAWSPGPGLTRLPVPLLPVVLAHGHRAARDDVTVLAVAPARRSP
ncbi:SpoIIE family protein phosphatase [Streptomyces roseolilacinus]|uniref:Anti-sigma regulatory factor n=1 Tax=Streptomyces roseolilacinus TaxID=66904 RepID=A0A918EMB5_9ACTN|nr:SpoIIE family protein phosphatase [Streptomyces roseolilacinus]GGQ31531.1 anti-sigma regulatory factor [Streptomyces roseolilacinus]